MASNLLLVQSQLKESNKELESYAYSTAHDLKQPIRNITGFANLLKDKLKSKNLYLEEETTFLNFIISGSENMEKLINDLIENAKHTKDKSQFEYSNILTTIKNVTASLKQQIDESNTSIVIEDRYPSFYFMPSRIHQLIQNLLSNAIKYRCENRDCKISISCRELDSCFEFCIEDNAIGIPENEIENIFKPFERVHDDENDYQGTGIGLSTCSKIVEQHNGKIWVESTLNKGSRFYFTLDKRILNVGKMNSINNDRPSSGEAM